MGSKAPIARKPLQDEPREERLLGRSDLLKASENNQLLERIADALQVSPAVLYNPLNAVSPAQIAGAGEADINLKQEYEALSHAYTCIRDPELRLRLLRLVQAAAEQD